MHLKICKNKDSPDRWITTEKRALKLISAYSRDSGTLDKNYFHPKGLQDKVKRPELLRGPTCLYLRMIYFKEAISGYERFLQDPTVTIICIALWLAKVRWPLEINQFQWWSPFEILQFYIIMCTFGLMPEDELVRLWLKSKWLFIICPDNRTWCALNDCKTFLRGCRMCP